MPTYAYSYLQRTKSTPRKARKMAQVGLRTRDGIGNVERGQERKGTATSRNESMRVFDL